MKELILSILLPYKEDPSKVAIENNQCCYLTSDGRKCAVGQMMKPGDWQHRKGGVDSILNYWQKEDVLKPEYQHLDLRTLGLMQQYHDCLAIRQYGIKNVVLMLEEHLGIELPELLN